MNKIIKNTLFAATAFVLVSVQLVESAAAQPKRNHQNQRVLGDDHGDGAAIIAGDQLGLLGVALAFGLAVMTMVYTI